MLRKNKKVLPVILATYAFTLLLGTKTYVFATSVDPAATAIDLPAVSEELTSISESVLLENSGAASGTPVSFEFDPSEEIELSPAVSDAEQALIDGTEFPSQDQASSLEEGASTLQPSPENNLTESGSTEEAYTIQSLSAQPLSLSLQSKRGWSYENGFWYYYDNQGKMLKDGWFWLAGSDGRYRWERLNSVGQAIDQIYEENGMAFYSCAGPDQGYHEGWKEANGFRYYFRYGSGTRVSGWQYIDGGWRYFRDSGTMISSSWAFLPLTDGSGSVWKYFNPEGINVLQFFKSNNKKWLTQAGPDTGYVKGWYSLNDFYYYFREDSGTMARGWQYIDGEWYYLRDSGTMVDIGWAWVPLAEGKGAAWKFFDQDGRNRDTFYRENGLTFYSLTGPLRGYARGFHVDEFGISYFFRLTSGTMVTGWQYINGCWRVFKDSGEMMKNAQFQINDQYYYADSEGKVYQNSELIGSSQLAYSDKGPVAIERVSITPREDGSLRYDYVNPITGATTEFDPETNEFIDGSLFVLDLSSHQDPARMDIDKIAKQIDGVILRVGFTGWGTGESLYLDDNFEYFYEEFSKRNIPIGGYWYSCADTTAEAVREANRMISALNGKQFELPIYWDTEDPYHQQWLTAAELAEVGNAFLTTLNQAGYYGGVYGSANWLRNELDMSRLSDTEVWVAHYWTDEPNYQGDYGMWQYRDDGELDGYSSYLDFNHLYKNYPRIISQLGMNGLPPVVVDESAK